MLKNLLSIISVFLMVSVITVFFMIVFQTKPQISNKAVNNHSVSPAISPAPEIKSSFIIRGSIPYWDQDNAFNSFSSHANKFNNLALFWYYLSSDGNVTKYTYAKEDANIIEVAHNNNVKVEIVITNLPESSGSTWDSVRVEKILSSPDNRKNHINQIMGLINRLNVDGVSIDYEQIDPTQRNNFSQFIKELSTVLHKNNKTVGVAIHPKTGEAGDSRYYFQNISEIAKYADRLYIMTYDEHENQSSPGPIASIPWDTKVINYIKEQDIQLNKIILGIPLYGYDWNTTTQDTASDIKFNDVGLLLSQYNSSSSWDEVSKSPYFQYSKDGDIHQVWYEDAKSILSKINLAKQTNLGGVTFWRIGEEDPNLWQEINN